MTPPTRGHLWSTTATTTTSRSKSTPSTFGAVIAIAAMICCKNVESISTIRQDYAISRTCIAIPEFITAAFEILLQDARSRSVVECSAKCQRISSCLSTVYCRTHPAGRCTLVIKLPSLTDLSLPLLGVSLGLGHAMVYSSDSEDLSFFDDLAEQRCRCVIPARLGLQLNNPNLLNLDLGLGL